MDIENAHIYEIEVHFQFLDGDETQHTKDSQKLHEVVARNVNEARGIAFKQVIENWDAGSIGITSIDVM